MKKSVDTPNVLLCHLCGKYIDPDGNFIRCRETSNVYCSRRCYYYDFVQSEKKTDPIFAQLDNILEHHSSNIEQKMNLLEAVNEVTSVILSVYGVYWFFPEVYVSNKWNIHYIFKNFNITPIDLDRLASDLYQMRHLGVCS
nr:hypothetical protein [Candidatus Freyarchaeota archaeon]